MLLPHKYIIDGNDFFQALNGKYNSNTSMNVPKSLKT